MSAGTQLAKIPKSELARYSPAAAAQKYASLSEASATVDAYASDWEHFRLWCHTRGLVSLPATPLVVSWYIADLAENGLIAGRRPSKSGQSKAEPPSRKPAAVSTISRRLASISRVHRQEGFSDSPTGFHHHEVKQVWSGLRRDKGVAQTQKAAITAELLRSMLEKVPDSLSGKRDRALLLIGFSGALRRSELVALTVADLQFEQKEGLVLLIRKSKTDQVGAGAKVGIPLGKTEATCPVKSLQVWLSDSGIKSGPVFRGISRWGKLQPHALDVESVKLIVKKYTELADLDPALYSGHSLRAGLATSAANAGASERAIMKQTRHKSEAMVRRYIRDANLFNQNVLDFVAL